MFNSSKIFEIYSLLLENILCIGTLPYFRSAYFSNCAVLFLHLIHIKNKLFVRLLFLQDIDFMPSQTKQAVD